MKRAAILLSATLVVLAACSSSDPYDEPQNERPRSMGDGGGSYRGAGAGGGGGMLEVLPPSDWWHNDRVATAVNLTSDQVASLDKIWSEQSDDVTRLQRDSQVAVRQLRDSLSLDQPKTEDITSAGQRIRTLRDDIFDRQLKMLAAERLVLSTQQWTRLEDALQNAREQRQDRRGNYPGGRGGRGGFGGRRPGGWGF